MNKVGSFEVLYYIVAILITVHKILTTTLSCSESKTHLGDIMSTFVFSLAAFACFDSMCVLIRTSCLHGPPENSYVYEPVASFSTSCTTNWWLPLVHFFQL